MNCKTKAINAACESGKVTVNGVVVPEAVIVSSGQAKSQGVALFSGADVFYVAVPVETLSQLIDLTAKLTQAVSSGVLSANAGGPITSGSFAADLAQLKASLDELKGNIQ